MKIKNSYFLYTLVLWSLTLIFSCSNDDDGDNGGGDGQATNYDMTCCQVPHLEACIEGANVFVPNAFTPNGDGINDVFYPYGSAGVKEVNSFKIFNGEGAIVHELVNFQPNVPTSGWDGVSPNGIIEVAVYTFTIVVENINGVSMSFDGSVCLRTNGVNELPCVDLEKHCAYGTQHDGNGGFAAVLPNFETCE